MVYRYEIDPTYTRQTDPSPQLPHEQLDQVRVLQHLTLQTEQPSPSLLQVLAWAQARSSSLCLMSQPVVETCIS